MSHWSEEPEGGYTVSPPVRGPETPDEEAAVAAGRAPRGFIEHQTPKADWICRLVWTIGDMAGLPAGTRIATNDDKLLIYSSMLGGQWVDRTGQLYSPLVSWLPVIVLPEREP